MKTLNTSTHYKKHQELSLKIHILYNIIVLRGVVNTNTLRSNKEQHSRVRECCLFIFLQSGGCLLHHTIEGVFSRSAS